MRIVIDIDGEKVTVVQTEPSPGAPLSSGGDRPPGPAPADLLKRAKKLGAMSAGAARFPRGAALASASYSAETSTVFEEKPKRRARGSRKR